MTELAKAYEPKNYEEAIYQQWLDSGFFNPDNLPFPADAPSYSIVLPPPNITDKLHLGHAAMLAIEDLLIRYHRAQGERTLWLPGTDHAAIATQNVVEKKLYQTEGKTRHDYGREEFLRRVWQYVGSTQATILHQIKKMGASLDWSRLAFTMDDQRQLAVRTMFKQMYEDGAIYRGERIVNWCPRCQSTLADDEVEYKEQPTELYTFKYSSDFPIAIATTRPETKLGDTAVAVNPQDERYKQYIGQIYQVDFCGQLLTIKIIADWTVDANFGTGAVGVTPAHSMTDWQFKEKHDLEIVKVITTDGLMADGLGRFSGRSVEEARQLVVEELEKRGLMIKQETITHNLSVCYRCGTAIEPLPSEQWFVSVDRPLSRLNGKSLKEAALEVVEKGRIRFVSERFQRSYLDWMKGLHDWCISRQIWFGHQIPVWYRGDEIFVGETAPEGNGWQQDPDTLDTWFSSGMWTFSTLGWPDNFKDGQKTGDLAKFHPNQVIETGYDILPLWVSRMIMMSLYAVGEVPFRDVYLHGLVLDEHGKKMSKSKGNGLDPLDMIDLYGTDPVRLSLLIGITPGNDCRLGVDKIASYRNFVNKLWNIGRYILSLLPDKTVYVHNNLDLSEMTLADKWILGRFDELTKTVGQRIDNYEFSLAGEALRDFTWNDLADWYLEVSKIEASSQKANILGYIFKNLLILWQPFIPFVTEVLWQQLEINEPLIIAKWPKPLGSDFSQGQDFALIQSLIVEIRNLRSSQQIAPSQKLSVIIAAGSAVNLITEQVELIKRLRTGLENVEVVAEAVAPEKSLAGVCGSISFYLFGEIEDKGSAEKNQKRLIELAQVIKNLEQRLANPEFASKAPAKIVEAERQKLADWQAEYNALQQK
ncbi:MAG TPA: valine--tRNA ligase [bacterium]|nr:valine--tRNA ligase [bacterium]